MALEGTLRDFGLAEIFQLISLQRKTGILTLGHEDEQATIAFIDGMVVAVDHNKKRLERRLGTVLVNTHRISQKELDAALAVQQQTLQRLGQVLVEKSFIKAEDLVETLTNQTREILYQLFRWSDGDYHFKQEQHIDYDREFFTPISADAILMETARMDDERPLIEVEIASLEVVVDATEKGRILQEQMRQNFEALKEISFNSLLNESQQEDLISTEDEGLKSLDPHQKYMLQMITHPSRVGDLVERSKLIEFETLRALYDLVRGGLLERIELSQFDAAPHASEQRSFTLSHTLLVPLLLIPGLVLFLFQWNPLNASLKELNPFAVVSTPVKQMLPLVAQALERYFYQFGEFPESLSQVERRQWGVLGLALDAQDLPLTYQRLEGSHGYRLEVVATGEVVERFFSKLSHVTNSKASEDVFNP